MWREVNVFSRHHSLSSSSALLSNGDSHSAAAAFTLNQYLKITLDLTAFTVDLYHGYDISYKACSQTQKNKAILLGREFLESKYHKEPSF